MKFSVCSVRNLREYQEDRHNVERNVWDNLHYFGVYDGHGGCNMSEICSSLMPHAIKECLRKSPKNKKKALRCAIRAMEEKSREVMRGEMCGSTFCGAIIDPCKHTITAANVGDSRMILRTTDKGIHQLTLDHNMENAQERQRIQKAGGVVERDIFGGERVMGVLNMTRSLGDWYLRPYVSHLPVVTSYNYRDSHGTYVIVGSDGLWDVLTNEDVCAIVDQHLEACTNAKNGKIKHNVARDLVYAAVERGSTDNITAIVVTGL